MLANKTGSVFFLVERCCTSAGRCCLHVCIHLAKFVLCLRWNERLGYWSIVSSPVTNIESNLQINFFGRIYGERSSNFISSALIKGKIYNSIKIHENMIIEYVSTNVMVEE